MSKIRDDQFAKIYKFLDHCPGVYAGEEADGRRFIEGVHWIMRTGAQWRELPAPYRRWHRVSTRVARWSATGIWHQMHHYFADDPDMEPLILESTIVRAILGPLGR